MATIDARLINQYKFKYQCVFLVNFDKQNKDGFEKEITEFF